MFVDMPPQPQSVLIIEANAVYATPSSSDSARSRRHERLAPNADMVKRIPQLAV